MTFGEEIRRIMKMRGIKALTLARRMGVSCAYVSQLLTGIRKPGRETLLKLSKALEVPPEHLLTIESDLASTTRIPRKVPILKGSSLPQPLDPEKLPHPGLSDTEYEYATTDDPHGFYITPHGLRSCCGLESCDLILVEPSKTIAHGDTVLVQSADGYSIRKHIVRDNMTILVGDREEPLIFTEENRDSLRCYKVSQCIKRL